MIIVPKVKDKVRVRINTILLEVLVFANIMLSRV
jgi:hypothetical protein